MSSTNLIEHVGKSLSFFLFNKFQLMHTEGNLLVWLKNIFKYIWKNILIKLIHNHLFKKYYYSRTTLFFAALFSGSKSRTLWKSILASSCSFRATSDSPRRKYAFAWLGFSSITCWIKKKIIFYTKILMGMVDLRSFFKSKKIRKNHCRT